MFVPILLSSLTQLCSPASWLCLGCGALGAATLAADHITADDDDGQQMKYHHRKTDYHPLCRTYQIRIDRR